MRSNTQAPNSARKDELAANLAQVRENIADAARSVGRAPEDITLLPVTKFHPASDIAMLSELGVRDVAENREQEARAKAEELPHMRFHMIGQIQTKKANSVARWAAEVHSVDSVKLADKLASGVELAIERGERELGESQSGVAKASLPVFIQLSADGDTARGGVAREDLGELIDAVERHDALELSGFMVVPPIEADAAEVFEWSRGLCDRCGERLGKRLKLSAGMSQDYRLAIENGADIVRVGTGIMGPRPIV